MKNIGRLVDFLLALCCMSFVCSFVRRHSGRRKWVRYAPAALAVTLIVFVYHRSRSVSLDDHTLQFHIDDDFIYRSAIIEPPQVHFASRKVGITVHVGLTLIFVGRDPHAAAFTKDTVTWVVVYSSAPVHFHLLTDPESVSVIEQIMSRAERQANCPFTYTIETINTIVDEMFDAMRLNVPQLKLSMLQDHVLTKMMPLILQWHYKDLERIIMVNTTIKFRSDVLELYEHFDRFEPRQVMGLTLTQGARFASAFSVHRHHQSDGSATKNLGLSPPEGWPGFNTDLILLDLGRMRRSKTFQRYVDLENQYSLVQKYDFASEDLLPRLDEWLTLVGVEKPELFYTIPCQWNIQQVMDSNAFSHCRNDIKAMEFHS